MLEERAIHKIEQDYDDFRNEMYNLTPQEIYADAYKIFIITELFMRLTSEYRFTRKMLKNIVLFKGNILEQIYLEWVRSDYSHQEHIEYICSQIQYRKFHKSPPSQKSISNFSLRIPPSHAHCSSIVI